MSYFTQSIRAIVVKDIVMEFRSKEVLPTMVVLGMLIVWVLRMVAEAGSVEARIMAPAALWISFLFCGLLAQEHSFAVEQPQDCISGLLLAPGDAGAIYLAKLLVNIIMLCVFEIVIVPVVLLVFNVTVKVQIVQLALVLILGNVAISSVGTLFSAMVQVSRVRGSLLSILVLVILMPVMIPATFALLYAFGALPEELMGTGALSMVGNFKMAVRYLLVFDVLFTTAGWLLFGFVVQE